MCPSKSDRFCSNEGCSGQMKVNNMTNLVVGRLYKVCQFLNWNLTSSSKYIELEKGEFVMFLSENYNDSVLTVVFLSPRFGETVKCCFCPFNKDTKLFSQTSPLFEEAK